MFKRMEWVKCKYDPTFWMSVMEVLPGDRYRCRFGTQGGEAGIFNGCDLFAYKIR